MLRRGNTKLGRSIWHFSIPAVRTCPGATPTCLALCYAIRHHFHAVNVKKQLQINWRASRSRFFVAGMVLFIRTREIRLVRIHVAGDWYSTAYVRKWRQIIDRTPKTVYFAYTRSWRVPELRLALLVLARRPNVRLWWSVDRDSGPTVVEPTIQGLAYLSSSEEDLPSFPVDLVFREKHASVRKHVGAALVCPNENGIAYRTPMTCERCGWCFRHNPKGRRNRSGHGADAAGRRIPLVLV